MKNNPPHGHSTASPQSLIVRDTILECLTQSPGMVRKEIIHSVLGKLSPDYDSAKVRDVMSYMIRSGVIHGKKSNGKPAKYYAGYSDIEQRIKIVPANQWHFPAGKKVSPIEWSVNQLQGMV